jgi:glycine hydroxymethyltransferase
MKEPEMVQIAEMIASVLQNMGDDKVISRVRSEVAELCQRFPLYPELG